MNKIRFVTTVLVFFYIGASGDLQAQSVVGIKGNQTVMLMEDTVSLLRNPCMGWGLYDDANDEVQQADVYWRLQDDAANRYASFFYVRWRWSDMEPQEGKYAWLYDENYKKLIRGALDRGLKLCFRIYDNSKDNLRQSTPDFVRKAGAKGYMIGGLGQDLWTPYPDDPVFQEKLANFVKAFAKEYDNPDVVDFIDGYSLGWWGECHGIILQEPSKLEAVFDWFTTLYSSNFKRVILTMPFNNQVGFVTEKRIAYDKKGYAMRRDGLGSYYFSDKEHKWADEMFGKTLLVGESCWWQCNTDDCRPFDVDKRYKFNTWRDVYELTYRNAIDHHFNTLDLREVPETVGWTTRANDLVKSFMIKGGYRLYPAEISLPKRVKAGNYVAISHRWKNTGNGYLPNNMLNWGYKYKPAFALIANGQVVKLWIDEQAEPSAWLSGKDYPYQLSVQTDGIAPGTYQWAVAIIDKTKNNTPAIKLAIRDKTNFEGWTLLTSVKVE